MGNRLMRHYSFDESLFGELENRVIRLRASLSIYENLYMAEESHIDLMNSVAPNFFGRVQEILIKDLALAVCKLLDPPHTGGNPNHSLRRLLWKPKLESKSRVEKLGSKIDSFRQQTDDAGDSASPSLHDHYQLACDLLDEARLFAKAETYAEPIRNARDKLIAHSDLNEFRPRDLSYGFSLGELKKAIRSIEEFFRKVGLRETGQDTAYSRTITEQDEIGVLKALRRSNDYERMVEEGEIPMERELWALSDNPDLRKRLHQFRPDDIPDS